MNLLRLALTSLLLVVGAHAQTRAWTYTPEPASVPFDAVYLEWIHADQTGKTTFLLSYANGGNFIGYRLVWLTATGKKLVSEELSAPTNLPEDQPQAFRLTPSTILLLVSNDRHLIRYALRRGKVTKATFTPSGETLLDIYPEERPLPDPTGFFTTVQDDNTGKLFEIRRYRDWCRCRC